MTTPDRRIQDTLKQVLATREFEIPAGQGFEGTGAPGLYLEHLLGLKTSNADVPDAGAWEVKFNSGKAPLTLFHKDPYPRGDAIRHIIRRWGWTGRNGRPSFRHTIWGESERCEVVDDAGDIRVRRKGHDDLSPYWPHDTLITAFSRKLSKLILVHGEKRGRTVRYTSAEFLSDAHVTRLIRNIARGIICIDFDCYIKADGAVRNHGTKFRIDVKDLPALYRARRRVH